MTSRWVRFLAWGGLALCVMFGLGAVGYLILGRSIPMLPTEFGVKGDSIVYGIAIGMIGTVVALRQPRNVIGWLFLVVGWLNTILAFTAAYARWALIGGEGAGLPGAMTAAWIQEWLWIPMVGGIALVALLFPDGRFLSRRWAVATWIALGLLAIGSMFAALVPTLTVYAGYENPFGVGGATMTALALAGTGLLLPLLVLAAVGAIVRFRRSRGEERLQLKWLVLSVSAMAALITFYGLGAVIGGSASNPAEQPWAEYLVILALIAIPVSIAFGVLKYRLYDIDVVISKAVLYGALAVFISIVYVVVVAGVGAAIGATSNAFLSAVAAAIVALAFQPARRRAQRLANRVVYGDRATPYQVLADLGERLAGEYAVDDVLDRVAAALADGVGAERTAVWLHVGAELRSAASWPSRDPAPSIGIADGAIPAEIDGMRTAIVRHQGDALGAIGVRKPAGDPLSPADEKLLGDLAAQAGLVLRNVRLIEELRASRQRLVAVQDQERRRIERDIHDGAQQQLVALAVKIRLADAMVGKDDERAHGLLADLQAETTDALENLRDLAHGIYPPLLADKGLVSALEGQARKAPIPMRVSHDGVGRYTPETEAAVYFCVLEALQNVGKYAQASRVDVALEATDRSLRFAVSDDGVGFVADGRAGAGVTNMRDRLDALGGSLAITSAPGRGTTVAGSIPV